jgi:hypothetical protein
MTQEDIIRMAREANASFETAESMFKFAALVAAAEREESAKVCDARAIEYDGFSAEQNASEKLAAAIRARGKS